MSRVFVSFAIEYKVLRDFLVGQKRNARTSKTFLVTLLRSRGMKNGKRNAGNVFKCLR